MGEKTRRQIRKERTKVEYLRYQKLKANPEFMKICEELKTVEEDLQRIKSKLKKISFRTTNGERIKASDPRYPKALKVHELQSEYRRLDKEKFRLENIMMRNFFLVIPINPLIKEWGLHDFSGTGSIFKEEQVVEDIPFEKPQWTPETKDVDYSNYLRDNRYLTVEIDTWHKKEYIIAALQDNLECLEKMGIIQFKKRIHLSTEEERIRAKKLQSEGKSLKEIAYTLWPDEFNAKEKEIEKKENVEEEERIRYEEYVLRLLKSGKTKGQAYKDADKKFRLKGKTPINPLIPKVFYLLKNKK